MLSQEFLDKIKEKLNKEKGEVEKKLSDLSRAERPMDNPNLDDLGHDASEDILEESLKSVYEDILERINNALLRTDNETYGKCPTCGADVPEKFLEEEPWAEHCHVCRKQE